MHAETVNRQGLSAEELAKIKINALLPKEIQGLIIDVKLCKDDKGYTQTLVSTCSWHNTKHNLDLLATSIPKDILISHGMCDPCSQEQNKLLDELENNSLSIPPKL